MGVLETMLKNKPVSLLTQRAQNPFLDLGNLAQAQERVKEMSGVTGAQVAMVLRKISQLSHHEKDDVMGWIGVLGAMVEKKLDFSDPNKMLFLLSMVSLENNPNTKNLSLDDRQRNDRALEDVLVGLIERVHASYPVYQDQHQKHCWEVLKHMVRLKKDRAAALILSLFDPSGEIAQWALSTKPTGAHSKIAADWKLWAQEDTNLQLDRFLGAHLSSTHMMAVRARLMENGQDPVAAVSALPHLKSHMTKMGIEIALSQNGSGEQGGEGDQDEQGGKKGRRKM